MRDTISTYLANRAKREPDLYVLSGDHGYALFDPIRSGSPEQFINVGVTEQAMIGYAAGMAKQGMKPVVYGLSAFIPMRVLEFIKMTVCYENLPVIFLGDGAGLVYSTLGPSHQCGEDIAALRSLPNMTIFSPADKYEMKACLEQAQELNSPCYIRIGKADMPPVHSNNLALGNKLIPLKYGKKVSLVATGAMASTAVEIAQELNFSAFSAPVLTGLDELEVLNQLAGSEIIYTLEEHSINGGLGSIISEIIAESSSKILVKRIGIQNRFTEKCGSYEYVKREHGLDKDSITQFIQLHN